MLWPVSLVFQHDRGCNYARESDGGHSDASRRVADGYNLHCVADRENSRGKWVAFKLSDGTSDGVLYDTKDDAASHQHHNERRMLFVVIRARSMTVCEAATLLRSARMLYDLGHYQDGPRVVIPRLTLEHNQRQLSRLQAIVNSRHRR